MTWGNVSFRRNSPAYFGLALMVWLLGTLQVFITATISSQDAAEPQGVARQVKNQVVCENHRSPFSIQITRGPDVLLADCRAPQ